MQRNKKRQLSYKHFSLSTTFIPHVLMYILNTKKKKEKKAANYLSKKV